MPPAHLIDTEPTSFVDALLAEQRNLTAVDKFAHWHRSKRETKTTAYRRLLPTSTPRAGEQYAFEVDLDKCSGCKACVTACHSLNGLEETETWREVGLLIPTGGKPPSRTAVREIGNPPSQQHVTTACHHCVDPGCLNGCPVLAYDKDPVTGIVRHLDDQCIGCQYCVMKCPYEVPKYSDRLGIVRKCDMCAGRLAVGEAPACVQACPSEAIRITLVDQGELRNRFREATTMAEDFTQNPFLPDSPNPRLTLPTTRYLARRPPSDLVAADHGALRLESPHWPLVIMLVLTQAATGLFLASAVMTVLGVPGGETSLEAIGSGLLLAGVGAAILHLGRPGRAWRSFLGWRTSWLSREIIAFNAVAAVSLATLIAQKISALAPLAPFLNLTTASLGLTGVVASAMVYVDTGRPAWRVRQALGSFLGTTVLLGLGTATVALGWTGHEPGAFGTAAAALGLLSALFIRRGPGSRASLRDPADPDHLAARVLRELAPWTQPARTVLFITATTFGVLALANTDNAPWWTAPAILATLGSELLERYLFFVSSAGKRMPGGVAA